jgi:hypothetical protein
VRTSLDSVFVGRLDDEQVQHDALRLLKVPVGAGYGPVIASLSRRTAARRTERHPEDPELSRAPTVRSDEQR